MNHELEFQDSASQEARKAKVEALASTYRRLFSTADGKVVLDDLKQKFGLDRPRFDLLNPNPNHTHVGVIEGQCSVLRDILAAIKAGE